LQSIFSLIDSKFFSKFRLERAKKKKKNQWLPYKSLNCSEVPTFIGCVKNDWITRNIFQIPLLLMSSETLNFFKEKTKKRSKAGNKKEKVWKQRKKTLEIIST